MIVVDNKDNCWFDMKKNDFILCDKSNIVVYKTKICIIKKGLLSWNYTKLL